MAEENNPVFQIQRMYLKDLSLEIPHAPHIFLEQTAPTVEVAIDTGHETLADGIYEVTTTVTVTTRIDKEKVVFLVEGKQAGIFEIRNIRRNPARLGRPRRQIIDTVRMPADRLILIAHNPALVQLALARLIHIHIELIHRLAAPHLRIHAVRANRRQRAAHHRIIT